MATYRLERVEIEPAGTSRSMWTFAGKAVRGIEHQYDVVDGNQNARNRWRFVVRVPREKDGRIEVRPIATPRHTKYAGLDRRSITFRRATRPGYTRLRYCPLALADPKGE